MKKIFLGFTKRNTSSQASRQRVAKNVGSPKRYSYSGENWTNSEPRARQKTVASSDRSRANSAGVSSTTKYWGQRFGLVIVLVVAVISIGNILVVSPDPKIVPVSSEGAVFLKDQSVYGAEASKLLSGFWNRNKITIDTNSIIKQMKQKFPELTDVSVVLPLVGHRPVVYIQPTKADIIYKSVTGEGYVMDENGRILAKVDDSVNLEDQTTTTVIDKSGIVVKLGQQALSSADVSFIDNVSYQLSKSGFTVDHFVLPAGTRELDGYLGGIKYFVKFNLEDGDGRQQAGSFIALAKQLQKQGITPAEYVDVRVSGRAYYK